MAKVITKGVGYNKTNQPLVGAKVTCRDCDCRWEVEIGDKVELTYDQRAGNCGTVICPECRASNTVILMRG